MIDPLRGPASRSGGGRQFRLPALDSEPGSDDEEGEEELDSAGSSVFVDRITVYKHHHSDVPTTPPFNVGYKEISQSPDPISTSRSCDILDQVGTDVKDEEISLANTGSDIPGQYHSGHGPWQSVIAYDACTRLCLNAWARGCMEAPIFLENECELLRDSFGLQHILLQSEEELLAKRSSGPVSLRAASKPKQTIGKMKVQVRKVRMSMDMPSRCRFPLCKNSKLKIESLRRRMSNLRSSLSVGARQMQNVQVVPHASANDSLSKHTLAYLYAGAQYIKQVPQFLKIGAASLRNNSSYVAIKEAYSCHLKLKSVTEEDTVQMEPGSGETHVFFPDSIRDNLLIEVSDSKGKFCGRALVQFASIEDDPSSKVRWWPIYSEPEHRLVGRVLLHVDYTTVTDDHCCVQCGFVAETVAYDMVLEVALKVQNFHQKSLLLHGSWKWLLAEFASYYGVPDAYTKLRYLSYVMDVATPTANCLVLVHDFLLPVISKSRSKNPLSHQERRILGKIEEKSEQILAFLFENYKSLDENSPSGLVESFSSSGSPAPALVPAIKLYTLLNDLSPEAQLKLYGYFQVAAKARSKRHLLETEEFVSSNSGGTLMDDVTLSHAYQKMKTLCSNFSREIYTDIEICEHHVLPSFIDLPNISASIYSVELSGRLRAFLVACPPVRPCPPVADLVIATVDFEKDLASWNICPVKEGVDAKELFHSYIISWIKDMRLALFQSCKVDKVKWSGVHTQQLTTPFVDEMYDRLKDTLKEYEVIIRLWPEYTSVLENAIAEVEKAVIEALEKHYVDILDPLKDRMITKKYGLKYVQKIAKLHSFNSYTVPDELGIFLNTMKRLLDVLWPNIEIELKSWSLSTPAQNTVAGERLSEVTVLLKDKFKSYLHAVVEKISDNTLTQSATKPKKIILDSKDDVMESDIRNRVQPLKDHLVQTINHLHKVFEGRVFVSVCRGYWDYMGQDVLSFLESQRENRSCYRGARVTVSILDEIFASQMQLLLGNSLLEKDLEPPRSIAEVHSLLSKDAPILDTSYF